MTGNDSTSTTALRQTSRLLLFLQLERAEASL